MEFALLTFVLVTAIVAGVYWLFVERTEAQEASHLRGRLRRSDAALTPKASNARQVSLCCTARIAAAVRERTPSLVRMLLTCRCTVRSLR